MHYPLIINVLLKFWWVIPILLVAGVFKTPWFKGIFGEGLVKLAAWLRLPSDTYHRIHNVTLETPDGTTQIDHVVVSRFGIFVVETKTMKGWIFGGEHQAQWTQKIFKKSFRFQNPLRQNYKHVKALEAVLDVTPEVIHSVVVFAGQSTFKTSMPANVTRGGGFITYIKSFDTPVLSEPEVKSAVDQIQSGRLAPSRATHRRHVQQLGKRSNPSAERQCPKCGSRMVLRTARRGSNAGNQFWGCSSYPGCRYMRAMTD